MALGFLSDSKNFCKLLCFPWSFCFARIRLDPLGDQGPAPRLHIGYYFEIRNFHWEPCDLLLTSHQNFQHEVPLRHCVFCTVISVLWQIAQFRSSRKCVQILCFPESSRLLNVGSKDTSWEELACESLCSGTSSSTKFSVNSCSHSRIAELSRPQSINHKRLRSIIVSFLFVF